MEEDLFSLAAGKQPSQQATNETASRAGEARENAGAGHPGNAEETAPRRIDYLRAELRRHNRLNRRNRRFPTRNMTPCSWSWKNWKKPTPNWRIRTPPRAA